MKCQLINITRLLILEPYVYYKTNETEVLFYNYYDYSYLYFDNEDVVRFFNCNQQHGLFVYGLSESDYENENIRKCIDCLIKTNNASCILVNKKNNPVSFSACCNVQSDHEKNLLDVKKQDKILTNLFEVTVYINSLTGDEKQFKDAYKQFPYLYYTHSYEEIDFMFLVNFLQAALDNHTLKKINFVIIDFDKYQYKEQFIDFICDTEIAFELTFFNLNALISFVDCLPNRKIENKNNRVNLILSTRDIKKCDLSLLKSSIISSLVLSFIVENEMDISGSQAYIERYKISNFKFLPYFNGVNMQFFKDFVYYNKKDLLNQKLNITDIYSNIKLNRLDYGKIIILANGDIYTNLNSKKIGNVFNDPLPNVISNAMSSETTWFVNKTEVQPCQDCVYNFLCSPITNYEYVIGRNNLCRDVK